MCHGPDVKGDHKGRRTACGWHGFHHQVGSLAENAESALGFMEEGGVVFEGKAGLEHGGVEGGLSPGEGEIGAAAVLDGLCRVRAAAVPSCEEIFGETLKTLAGDFRNEGIPVAKMAVWGGTADARGTSDFGEGEPVWSTLADHSQGTGDKRLPKVSVVVAASARAVRLRAHEA